MAGKSRTERAASTAGEFFEMITKLDTETALALVNQMQAQVEDKRRILQAESVEKDRQREARLKIIVGHAVLRLLVEGDDNDRARMRAHLDRLIENGHRDTVPGEIEWVRALWARRADATAARHANRQQKSTSTRADSPSLTAMVDKGEINDASLISVSSVTFPATPGMDVLRVVRDAGLAWFKPDHCWRPRDGKSITITVLQADAIRTAGGVITEA